MRRVHSAVPVEFLVLEGEVRWQQEEREVVWCPREPGEEYRQMVLTEREGVPEWIERVQGNRIQLPVGDFPAVRVTDNRVLLR
jgi:hypothetical protein